MKFKSLPFWAIGLVWLLFSCSGGSSSGGNSTVPAPTTTPAPVTYTTNDMVGTWNWVANRQSSPLTLSGTMTFNNTPRLIGYECTRCPGRMVLNAEFWMFGDFVKGRNYAFCSDTTSMVKFGMYLTPDKKSMSGIMDLHYLVDDGTETYDRYDITLKKQ